MKWILALFNFLQFNIVENGGGETSDAVENETAETTEENATETVDVAEEAWNALQDAEVAEDPEVKEEQAESEQKPEPEKVEEKAEEKAPESITDDDLKPLDSKNPKTNERFQKVTEGYKTEKARADALTGEVEKYKQSFDSLKQLGFNDQAAAEDLVEFSAYRHILATGDADQFKAVIQAQIQQFELMHGKPIKVNSSALEAYPDLQEKVTGLDLDEATALEVARARRLQERAARDTQQRSQNAETEQQQQIALNEAVNAVVELEQTWRNTDPDFNAVFPYLQEQIAEIKKLPPSTWANVISTNYKAIKKAMASTPKPTNNSPLRGNGHQSGKPVATSMQEAVLAEMGML